MTNQKNPPYQENFPENQKENHKNGSVQCKNDEKLSNQLLKTKTVKLSEISDEDLIKYSQRYPIAIPTETVYGLSAPADNANVISQIYTVKNRPKSNPLILHVLGTECNDYLHHKICFCVKCKNDIDDLLEILTKKNDEFLNKKKSEFKNCFYIKNETPLPFVITGIINRTLIEKFWPGPLTLIASRGSKDKMGLRTGDINKDLIAIRCPSHPVAREYIKRVGPVFAPSANLSGRVSTTRLDHVESDLNGRIEFIIEDTELGIQNFGLESTIYSAFTNSVLRPGFITKEQIDKAVEHLIVRFRQYFSFSPFTILVPGTQFKHYSPICPLEEVEVDQMAEKVKNLSKKNGKYAIGIIVTSDKMFINDIPFEIINHEDIAKREDLILKNTTFVSIYDLGRTIEEHQARLFVCLRSLEKYCDIIFIPPIQDDAIIDRVTRARMTS
ncbi:RNA binding/translational regulation protein of the SUA5 family [Pseudoloma neurophilia]|uniref:Threonylcarbamoyl-AMP synthase n=1 Tax=Pseudoloma neurophilia TaxID=146866 RepID=A0A0R0M311_9MICR|nr:RNA binding/translational regulation protein of the SUA5 family [Pseudoloma neurophilia]